MIVRGEGICYEKMFSRVGLVVTTHSLEGCFRIGGLNGQCVFWVLHILAV